MRTFIYCFLSGIFLLNLVLGIVIHDKAGPVKPTGPAQPSLGKTGTILATGTLVDIYEYSSLNMNCLIVVADYAIKGSSLTQISCK